LPFLQMDFDGVAAFMKADKKCARSQTALAHLPQLRKSASCLPTIYAF